MQPEWTVCTCMLLLCGSLWQLRLVVDCPGCSCLLKVSSENHERFRVLEHNQLYGANFPVPLNNRVQSLTYGRQTMW